MPGAWAQHIPIVKPLSIGVGGHIYASVFWRDVYLRIRALPISRTELYFVDKIEEECHPLWSQLGLCAPPSLSSVVAFGLIGLLFTRGSERTTSGSKPNLRNS